MRLKVRPRYVLAFAIRGKKKLGSFYAPQKNHYADYFEHQEVWIAEMGAGCKIEAEGAAVGRKGFIVDSFELEEIPLSLLWPTYKAILPKAVVDEILTEAKRTEGYVAANLIHEDSIFALEETDRWESSPLTLAK